MEKYLYEWVNSAGNLSTEDILLRIAASVLFGCAVFLSYRLTHTGTVYSQKFNITLLTLTVLTTTVMTVIGNNVALSLGMVGALSIVRFRTSIKDSRDTIYIFWTIIIGICCGVGDYVVAAVGSGAVFLVLLLFGRVKNENRMLLIIRANRAREDDIRRLLFSYFRKPPLIRSQNTTAEKTELIYEVNRRQMQEADRNNRTQATSGPGGRKTLTEQLYELGGIDYVNIVLQSDEIA